jgi:hypothetical protein
MARALKATDPKAAKPSKPKILVWGRPGVGKTWTALDFPSAVLVDCEGGANLPRYTDKLKASGGVYLGPDQGANDFATVTEEIITLATTPHQYRTLIIDSGTKILNTAIAAEHERMEKSGRDMEKTFGAEKKPALNWVRRWLRWFEKLDMAVLIICHEKDEYRDGKLVGSCPDFWDKIQYELHLSLNIVKQGSSRKARVTKSRLEGFADSETFEWGYEEFARRFGRDVIEAQAEPTQLATTEQIAKFDELMAVVKVDPKVTEKWAENGDSSDLTYEDLQKRIDYLTKLLPKATVK